MLVVRIFQWSYTTVIAISTQEASGMQRTRTAVIANPVSDLRLVAADARVLTEGSGRCQEVAEDEYSYEQSFAPMLWQNSAAFVYDSLSEQDE